MAADGSVIIEILGDAKGFSSTLGSLATKAGAAFTGIAAAGIAALTKMSVSAYADYEQLVGGVETLFKESAGIVEQYAANAFQTAGLSANDYMETVTSFSASLLQGLGGDTAQAAEIANTAITDMADNANKMGTSMQSIQDAYRGFAKRNFDMLDNLKLGYGGTQSEMIRLINDSGILNDTISSLDGITFDQMIAAIHVIQTEMGITGTTAKEASDTIQGSVSATKAAWENLLTGIADENANIEALVGNVISSAATAAQNIVPRIGQALSGIGTALQAAVPMLAKEIPSLLASVAPSMSAGLLQLTDIGAQFISGLTESISSHAPELIPAAMEAVVSFSSGLRENVGHMADAGLTLILSLAQSLIANIPMFIATVPQIVTNIAGIINDNAPKLLTTGLEIIGMLASGLIQAIPALIANIPQIIQAIVAVFSAFNWWQLGDLIANGVRAGAPALGNALKSLAQNAIDAFKSINWASAGSAACSFIRNAVSGAAGLIANALRSIGTQGMNAFRSINWASVGRAAVNFIKNAISGAAGLVVSGLRAVGTRGMQAFTGINWASVGKQIINGIVRGISGAASALFNALRNLASSALDSAKRFLGIASPSKLFRQEIGRWIPPGIGIGVEDAMPELEKTLLFELDNVADSVQARVNHGVLKRANATTYGNHTTTYNANNVHGGNKIVNINYHPEQKFDKPVSLRDMEATNKRNARHIGRVIANA